MIGHDASPGRAGPRRRRGAPAPRPVIRVRTRKRITGRWNRSLVAAQAGGDVPSTTSSRESQHVEFLTRISKFRPPRRRPRRRARVDRRARPLRSRRRRPVRRRPERHGGNGVEGRGGGRRGYRTIWIETLIEIWRRGGTGQTGSVRAPRPNTGVVSIAQGIRGTIRRCGRGCGGHRVPPCPPLCRFLGERRPSETGTGTREARAQRRKSKAPRTHVSGSLAS